MYTQSRRAHVLELIEGRTLADDLAARGGPGLPELRAVQAQVTSKEKALERLLENLGLGNPAPEGRQALGRTIVSDIHVGMHAINPALIMQELFALQAALEYGSVVPLTREAVVCQAVAGLDPTRQPETAILRDALLESGVAGGSIARELKLQLLALYDTACPDGCPVCLSAGSDIEHYALAPLLHSRRALRKLREVLRAGSPRNDCLAAVAQSLRAQAPAQVQAYPADLGDQLDPSLGLAVLSDVNDAGQVDSTTVVAIDVEKATEFLTTQDGWEERWGDERHRKIRAPDGTMVRSRAEYIIVNELLRANIGYQYELPFAFVARCYRDHPPMWVVDFPPFGALRAAGDCIRLHDREGQRCSPDN